MPSASISSLRREDITAAARRMRGSRAAKWTVIVEGRELPARPLVLEAAGVPPNDPTNSHQAVKILQDHGFDVRYEGRKISQTHDTRRMQEIEDLIESLRGCCKPQPGEPSLLEMRDREHWIEKSR